MHLMLWNWLIIHTVYSYTYEDLKCGDNPADIKGSEEGLTWGGGASVRISSALCAHTTWCINSDTVPKTIKLCSSLRHDGSNSNFFFSKYFIIQSFLPFETNREALLTPWKLKSNFFSFWASEIFLFALWVSCFGILELIMGVNVGIALVK